MHRPLAALACSTRARARLRACRRVGVVLLAAFLLVNPSSSAAARLSSKQLAQLRADLFGPGLERAVDATRLLARLGNSRSDKLLISALQMGAPPPLVLALLDALRQRKPPAALGLLRHYGSYRNPKIRMEALKAVAALPQPGVVDVLLDALGDSTSAVRQTAAELLGQRRERRAASRLLVLLGKGDGFAAGPLGSVASADTATKLADLVGVLPPATVARAFAAMLRRSDFGPDPLRVRIVRALGRFSEVEATTALLEYIASVPARETRLSKTIAEQLVAGRGL